MDQSSSTQVRTLGSHPCLGGFAVVSFPSVRMNRCQSLARGCALGIALVAPRQTAASQHHPGSVCEFSFPQPGYAAVCLQV